MYPRMCPRRPQTKRTMVNQIHNCIFSYLTDTCLFSFPLSPCPKMVPVIPPYVQTLRWRTTTPKLKSVTSIKRTNIPDGTSNFVDLIRAKKLRTANVLWLNATLLWKPLVAILKLMSPSSNFSRDNWFNGLELVNVKHTWLHLYAFEIVHCVHCIYFSD